MYVVQSVFDVLVIEAGINSKRLTKSGSFVAIKELGFVSAMVFP
jgi:hypothetical protein